MRNIIVIAIFGLLLVGHGTVVRSAAEPVRMAYLQNDLHHLALWVALDQGFLREGENVRIAGIFRAGPEIMTSFAAGALDMAYVGMAPSVTASANKTARVLVVSQANAVGSALVVPAEAAIRNIKGLTGKTIAVPGHATVQDFLLKKTLKEDGVDVSKVTIMVLKPPEMIAALRTGQIDGFIAWEPYPSQAATLKVGRNLMTSREMWPGHPCCAVVAESRFAAQNPDKVQAFVLAHLRATEFIREHPDKAVAIGVKHTGLDADIVRLAMQNVDYNHRLDIESVRTYVQFLSNLGYIRVTNTDDFIESFIHRGLIVESRRP